MIDHLNTPFFGPNTIREALENMRKGKSIRRSPLSNLVWIRTRDRWGDLSEVAIDVALRDALAEIVETRLTSFRKFEELPAREPQTRSAVVEQLRADFQAQNAELEAWSAIYHRYVRLDFGLQAQALADAAHVTDRQIRRRLKHGFFRLAEEVTSREREARRQNRRLALSVKLPPPSYAELYGRDSLCEDLVERISERTQTRVIVLAGPGGVGKSSVAHQVADQLIQMDHFEDLLWLTLDQPLDYDDVLHAIAEILGYVSVFEPGEQGLAHNIGVRLRQIRTLLVVDPIDYVIDFDSHLAELGYLVGDGQVLATSRHIPDSESPVIVMPVDPLESDAFRQLLKQEFRRQRRAIPAEEILLTVEQIAGGNPLAGKLIVRQMKILAFEQIMDDLGDQPTYDGDRLFDYLFAHLWDNLSVSARQTAIGIILFPPDLDVYYEDLALILDLAPDALQDALGQLVESSLVSVEGRPPRYQMSALIRQFVWKEAGKEAHRPTLRHLLTEVKGHTELDVTPILGTVERVLSIVGYHDLSILSQDDIQGLVNEVGPLLRRSGQWRRWQHVLDRLEAMISESESGESSMLPVIWTELGMTHRQQGHIQEAEAYAHLAVAAFGEAGDFQDQARAMIELGRVYEARGLMEPALEAFQRSAAVGERHQDYALWRRAANQVASHQLHLGKPKAALQILAQVADQPLSEEGTDDPETFLLQGQAHQAQGHFAEASQLFETAHQLYIEDGDVPMVARTHFHLTLAAHQVGDNARFLDHLWQGFTLMYTLGDFVGLSRLITLMGIVRFEEGVDHNALAIWEAARELQLVVGDFRGQALTQFHLADAYWKMGRVDEARQALDGARSLAEEYGIASLIDEISRHPLLESGGGGYNGED